MLMQMLIPKMTKIHKKQSKVWPKWKRKPHESYRILNWQHAIPNQSRKKNRLERKRNPMKTMMIAVMYAFCSAIPNINAFGGSWSGSLFGPLNCCFSSPFQIVSINDLKTYSRSRFSCASFGLDRCRIWSLGWLQSLVSAFFLFFSTTNIET